MTPFRLPRLTQHGSEIVLLGMIAVGVVILIGKIIDQGGDGYDLAAFLLVLQAIITAIKDRWQQRSVDRMGDQLAAASPPGTQQVEVINTPADPVPVEPARDQ